MIDRTDNNGTLDETTAGTNFSWKHLEAAAAILFKNTPRNQLQDFESLELALRDQLAAHVHPKFGHFFYAAAPKRPQEESE